MGWAGVGNKAMCPMLDMINHDHGARPRFSYDARQDVFSVAADRNYPKGQQVASLPLCLLEIMMMTTTQLCEAVKQESRPSRK